MRSIIRNIDNLDNLIDKQIHKLFQYYPVGYQIRNHVEVPVYRKIFLLVDRPIRDLMWELFKKQKDQRR